MNKSPFAPHLDNFSPATLTILASFGELRQNPKTLNMEPVQTPIQLTALLGATTKDPTERTMPGVDVNEVYVRGHLVNPMSFPAGVKPPLECDVEIGGQRGRLRLEQTIPFPALENRIGRFLQGYLRFNA